MNNISDGRLRDRKTKEYIRQQSVKMFLDGKSAEVIADTFGICRTTIYKWMKMYKKGGHTSLSMRPIRGAPPKLRDDQWDKLRSWIIGKDPRQYGMDFGLWTRKYIQQLILERFGVSMGLTAVGRGLHRLGIVPVKPLKRAYQRNPIAIEEWKSKRYPELKARAKANNGVILFIDESGVRSDSVLGKTWGQKGKRTTISTTGARQSINAISAVSESGAFWFDVYSGGMNAKRFIAMLQKLMRGRKRPVYLVLDGHPSHRANIVKEFVQSQRGKIELHFLPGYAPDLNPDELVWNYVKAEGPKKRPLQPGECIRELVTSILSRLKLMPRMVASFVRHVDKELGIV
jgi:transposase